MFDAFKAVNLRNIEVFFKVLLFESGHTGKGGGYTPESVQEV